ncbi:hypothetical protein M378DRAFT_812748 [Amanita muscaria Koide BX008]|uniref:Uncharacterized protein n=1 Tax=Amanita muscaria (strain Koide BX008) TaxID=946122 RepID=A0A0C2T5P0_AMAMK|nr:hypothetical protein M378DRAFT_812748 [Amanita muscaria Koide BX008]
MLRNDAMFEPGTITARSEKKVNQEELTIDASDHGRLIMASVLVSEANFFLD